MSSDLSHKTDFIVILWYTLLYDICEFFMYSMICSFSFFLIESTFVKNVNLCMHAFINLMCKEYRLIEF